MRDSFVDKIYGVMIFFCSFILYYLTLAPTVTWGDSAKLCIYSNDLVLSYLPGSHSLHNLIGHFWGLIPFDDYAYGQNMLSAVFSALTVVIIFIITLKITQSIWSSLVSSIVLALSHSFWLFSVINESYSLMFFIISLALLHAIIWKETKLFKQIFFVFFFLSLGLSNHYLIAILIPSFIVYFLVVKPRLICNLTFYFSVVLGVLLGSFLLLFILFQNNKIPFIHIEFFSFFNELLSWQMNSFYVGLNKIGYEIIRYPSYLFYQFPVFGFFVGILGFIKSFRQNPKIFLLLTMIFISVIIFSLGYQFQRQFNLITPSYLIFSIWIGIGFNHIETHLFTRKNQRTLLFFLLSIFVATPTGLYYSIPTVLNKYNYMPIKIRNIPFRDSIKYFLLPDKSGNYNASIFCKQVFQFADPKSVILGDFTSHEVLRYMQKVNGVRPEIVLSTDYTFTHINNLIDSGWSVYIIGSSIHPFYLSKYGLSSEDIRQNYNFVKMGPINKLIIKNL